MAHSNVAHASYANSVYSASHPQPTSRIISYQPTAQTVYYDMLASQQQQHQALLDCHSPKVECSSPSNRGSPVLGSANHSPDPHHFITPHIVPLSNSASSSNKLMLDNGHLERPTVVSISS